jgi:hypothetical protein
VCECVCVRACVRARIIVRVCIYVLNVYFSMKSRFLSSQDLNGKLQTKVGTCV